MGICPVQAVKRAGTKCQSWATLHCTLTSPSAHWHNQITQLLPTKEKFTAALREVCSYTEKRNQELCGELYLCVSIRKPLEVNPPVGILLQLCTRTGHCDSSYATVSNSVVRQYLTSLHWSIWSRKDCIVSTCYSQKVINGCSSQESATFAPFTMCNNRSW